MYEKWMRSDDTTPRDPLMIFAYHPMHASMARRYGGLRTAPMDPADIFPMRISLSGLYKELETDPPDRRPGGVAPGTPPRSGAGGGRDAGPPRANPTR